MKTPSQWLQISNRLCLSFQMREMRHENINPFIGCFIDPLKPSLVWEYCSRKSLEVSWGILFLLHINIVVFRFYFCVLTYISFKPAFVFKLYFCSLWNPRCAVGIVVARLAGSLSILSALAHEICPDEFLVFKSSKAHTSLTSPQQPACKY